MRLSYRSAENILRLTLDVESGTVAQSHELPGRIDIAEQGRLVGIEIDADGSDLPDLFSIWMQDGVARDYLEIDDAGAYVGLSAPSEDIPEQHIRTAELPLIAEMDASAHLVAIAIPRRGHGYEISFPSGNQ
ncbi:MAG: hypothetical protein WD401_06155 [Thermomicrobiaceae bacterium]